MLFCHRQVVSAKEALQEARTQSQASAHVASQEHETALQRERDKAVKTRERIAVSSKYANKRIGADMFPKCMRASSLWFLDTCVCAFDSRLEKCNG